MGWYGGGMGGAAWVFMGLFWIALVAAIVWLVAQLLASRSQSRTTPPAASATPPAGSTPTTTQPSPLDILDRRFAQGEIDLETYQAHRAALLGARGNQG